MTRFSGDCCAESTLLMTQRHHGIDTRRASRRDITREQRHRAEEAASHREGERIRCADIEHEASHEAGRDQCRYRSGTQPDGGQSPSFAERQAQHVTRAGTVRSRDWAVENEQSSVTP